MPCKRKTWRCQCGNRFTTTSNLNHHKLTSCPSEPIKIRFACEFCNEIFTQKSSVRRHQYYTCKHEQNQKISQVKYICVLCKKSYRLARTFSVHLCKITDIKKYRCKCGNKYTHLSKLKHHQRKCQ